MSQDAVTLTLELRRKKPFNINDLAGGRGALKCLILNVFIKKPISI